MVKRLRRRPLTAETGVRFPMGLPKKHTTISSCVFCFTSDRVFHIALQAVILARRDAVFFIARKPLFLHGGEGCFFCAQAVYSCTAGRGVFLLLCKPVILARRGVVFFIALQARYSCTAGCDVFYCPASPLFLHGGAWGFLLPCKPRRVLHGKMRGCNRTTNRIFHGKLHILYWHSPLYGKPCVFLWKNTRLRKIFTQAGVFL